MSNLSDIGFPVKSDDAVNQLLMDVLPFVKQVACPPFGYYYQFTDGSGAEIFLQANPAQDLIGFNPGFSEGGSLSVRLLKQIARDTSELDGGYVCRAEEGGAAFVFDIPNFRESGMPDMESKSLVELTAFASNDLKISVTENSSGDGEPGSIRHLRQSAKELVDPDPDSVPPQAHASIEGFVESADVRTNTHTGCRFYLISVKTDAGQISVVADPELVTETPRQGSRISGSFWLSGKLVKVQGAVDQ